ncbi:MAG: DNRLRE domain-containing protein, partial [Lewinellaceae bacterium]|nr:DNRLRE domain-containing protein [Lewinellaceae bacterium]
MLFACLLNGTQLFAQGFASITNLTALTVSANTGEKPQSKVWTYDGKWWAVMPNGTGTHLWRLDGTTWTDMLTLSAATNTNADCKVDGALVHILLYQGTSSNLVSVEYVPMSSTYQLWTTRPTPSPVTLDAGVETATIDIDGTGRMWLASAGTSDINVRWSDSPYSTWSSAITIGTGVADDDICAIIYLPGKIGVLWSNQNTERFGFKTHTDGDAPTTWSADEVPASQSAQNVGLGMADDHLNMAVATDGTLYCAVKTSYDVAGYPKMALLIRRPAGTWDDLYPVSETGTRPIVLLNEAIGKFKIFYSSTEGGGDILYKESATSSIALSTALTLISGTNNDVTSTKQNYSSEVVLLASNGSSAAGVLAVDDPNPLVCHLEMEEGSGTTLVDSSPYGNDASTVGNPTWTTGVVGQALNLDGSTQYATVPDAASLDITTAITLAAWIKPAGSAFSTQYIIKKATQGGTNGYELSLSTLGEVFVRFNQAASANTYRLNSITTYPLNSSAWMHIAATFDQNTGLIKLYINGAQEGGDLPGPAAIATNNLALGIGAQPDGVSKFNGMLDDVRVYNKALTLGEIQALASVIPDPPVLASPADNATGVGIPATLTWNAAAGATDYQVQVSLAADFSSTVYDQSGIATTSTAVSGLAANTQYYWRVNASSNAGTSGWSTVWNFTTAALSIMFQDGLNSYNGTLDTYIDDVVPGTVRGAELTFIQDKTANQNLVGEKRSLLRFDLSAIPAGSTILSAELQFYVNTEGQGFTMYRMLVPWTEAVTYNSLGGRHFVTDDVDAESTVNATWPGDDNYVGFITVSVPASTIQDWIDGNLDNNGWLMVATDGDDGQQLRSREAATVGDRPKLTVYYSSATAPDAPTLVSPADMATGVTVPPTLSWNAAAGADTYQVQVSTASDFSSTVFDQSGIVATSVVVPGLADNTLYYWRVNATNGNGTSDWSAVWSFTTGTSGAFSLDFDGSTNYVDCGNPAALHVTDFTLEAWIKIEGTGASVSTGTNGVLDFVPIVSKGRGDTEDPVKDVNFALGYQLSTNKLAADFEDNINSANHPAIGNATLGNCWTHVAATYNSATGIWKLYVNGALDQTVDLGTAFVPQSLSDVKASIGTTFNADGVADGFFNGLIDEARIWNLVRSDGEIAADYAAELNSGPGLVARYGLNTGSGSTAINDLGPDGSIAGTPVWTAGFVPGAGGTADAGGPYTTCNTTPVNIMAITNSTGVWSGGLGTFGSTTSASTTYTPDVSEVGTNVTLTWTTDAGACDPVSDDAILTVNGQGAATSLDFNGSSDYVSFGAASPELNATSFTLEAWIKIEGAGVTTTTSGAGGGGFEGATAAVPIVTKGRGEGESPANINMNYFMGLVGNKLAADFEEPAGPNHSVIGNATLPSNTWTHIAATYDQPSGVWNLYINGALDKTLNLGTGFSPANTSIQHAAVGTAMNSTGVAAGFFNGLVDEVRIWNVARTPTEILDNYALELTGGTGLIGRWGFNEGCGLTATNSINASPNGTLSSANGPVWSTDIPSGPVAPDAPTLVSPANNATNIGLPPTLSWNAAAGATTYRVQLSLVSNFSSVEYDQSGLGTTSVSVPSLFENTLYYWRVNATNAGGTSDWSTVWSFTTAATGAYALDFNGSNNLVDCGNDASLHVTNFTLEAWIKIEAPGVSTSTGSGGITNIVPIIMKGRAEAESALVDVNYALGYQLSTNKLVADFEDNATSANHPAISNATLGNCWTHVAATYDVSGVWKLYINGVLDGTTNLGGAFTPQSLSDVKACIGSSFNSSGTAEGYFNGLIDEVRVWDVVRSDAEIAADYANDLNSGSGLTARYGFNTGNGSVAVNSLGPDGAISGTPVWVDGYAPAGTLASSLDFNGTTDYVTFGAAPELNATNFTLEAWIKIEGTGTTVSTGTGGITAVPIVTKGRGESETGNLNMNYFMGLIGNKLAADFEESTGPNHPVTGVADIPNNVWTHVAATYDVANAEWKLYINGVQDQTLDLGSNISPVGNSIQHAGVGTAMTSTGAVAGYFNGLIDEVRIWNVVRTQPEIQANYTMELTSGTGLIGRWGFNDGCGLTAVNSIPSSPNGTLSSATGPVWVLDSPVSGPINNAPDQPANPSPADLATAPSTSPDLCVDVSDPDGDALRVRYYARPKATAGAPFTIVWLPDTQYYVEEPQVHGGTPAMFNSQTAWVVNNEVAENIVYVGQLGDCVEHGDYPSNPTFGELEWDRAKTAMYALEPPEIPYGVCAGNHDQSPIGDPNGTTTRFNEAFGFNHFMGRPYYGGHYGIDNNDNHFQIFSASGIDFMVISFEYDQSSNFNAANGPLDWAEDLVADSSHRKVIVMSHHVLSDNGNFSTQGQYIYNRLKAYPNFIMMVGGHDPGGDGEARRSDVNQIGMTNYTVHTILSDYQARTNGGNGLMRIFRFEPATNNVAVKTYSPFTNTYEQDGSSEFNLTVDLGGSQVPFVMIGELNDVPSGTSPCVNYAGLDGCTEYEWYVELFDGTATTTGPVWTFTTPGGGNATITPDGPTTFCEGGSVTLTASSGDSYLWSTMETTQSIVVTTSGSYTVEVTTAGCTGSSTSTEVTVNGLGTANAGADQMTCINGVVYLQGAVGGTSTGGTWSANVGGGTFFPSATNLVTFYIPPSGYSDPITLTLTGDGPCPASDDLVVTYGPLPPVTLTASGPSDATCGQDVVITIEVASGFTDIKSYQYVVEWDPLKFQYVTHNAPAIDGEPATVFTNNTSIGQLSYGWIDQSGAITGKTLSNGSTVLTVTLKPLVSSGMDEPVNIIGTVITPMEASNSQQCLLTLTPQNNVAIDFNPISVSCPANTMICSDASPLTLTGENPTGGSYSGTGVDMGMFDPAAAGTGPHEITYNYTDGNSCAAFCTFTITVIAPPTADAPGDVTACDSYTLPVLTVGNYFTGSGGTGTALNAGA